MAFLLLETGDFFLLESGGFLILEDGLAYENIVGTGGIALSGSATVEIVPLISLVYPPIREEGGESEYAPSKRIPVPFYLQHRSIQSTGGISLSGKAQVDQQNLQRVAVVGVGRLAIEGQTRISTRVHQSVQATGSVFLSGHAKISWRIAYDSMIDDDDDWLIVMMEAA